MPTKTKVTILVVSLIVILLLAFLSADLYSTKSSKAPNVFLGVDIGYGGEEDVYRIANAVSGYTNLIILGSLNLTENTPALTRVCDFLYQKGFYFIIFVGFSRLGFLPPRGPDQQFFDFAANRWGNKMLGAYIFDEVGGKQLDERIVVPHADTFDEAATTDVSVVGYSLITTSEYYSHNLTRFTSDYGLQWFDYVAEYDTVFTEFAGLQRQQNKQIAIALDRGAAKTQNKSWGTIITWQYDQPPYLENATELYSDMVLAYQNGAKYIIVFDSPGNNTALTDYGILTTEQLSAIQEFWNYQKATPQPTEFPADTAYVLPTDYGFGFRSPNDSIWGLWSSDTLTQKIWNDSNSLLATYRSHLDIIYENRIENEPTYLPYNRLIFWNGTIVTR